MSEMLPRKKTYIASLGIVLSGVGAFLAGEATVIESLTVIFGGLGLAALRMGVEKSGPSR